MLKQKRQLFEFFFMATDLVVITIAWFLSYWLRFQSELIASPKGVPPFTHYLSMVLFIWLIWAFVFKRFGLYRPMRGVRRTRELFLLVQANCFAVLLFIAVTYIFREKAIPFSRLVFLYFAILSTILTAVQRSFLRFVLREIRRRGYNLRYMIIVGAGKVAGDIATRIRLHRELGIQLLGCLSKTGTEKRGQMGIPVVGAYADLERLLNEKSIDQVVVALPLEDNQLLPDVMSQIGDHLIDVRVVPDIYQFISLGGAIEEFEGLPVISLQESPLDGINLFAKRAFDILVGIAALVILSPFMLLVAMCVKLTSRGPVFYTQERVSFDGTPFKIYKFRTMRTDSEEQGPGWTTAGDGRVTSIGKFLRSWSIDEFPQLFNVIKGDMSLVGPRPERPVYIQDFRKRIPRYMLRHKVPAGMTGWAQVHGWRGDTSIDKRIEFDLYYIENWSLVLDLKIMFLTIFRGFKGKNAY
jgi:Undecaprenyl-phosphate glucose phosphotransferase